MKMCQHLQVLLAVCILFASATLRADPPDGRLKLSREIRYAKPQVTVLEFTRTTRLIEKGAVPSRIDYVLVFSEPLRDGLVGSVQDISDRIAGVARNRIREEFGQDIPIAVEPTYNDAARQVDHRPGLERDGYTKQGNRIVHKSGLWVEIYARPGYPVDADFGEARVTVKFKPDPTINDRGHIQLNVVVELSVQTRNVPRGTPREVLDARVAHFRDQVRGEADAVARALNGRSWNLQPADKQRFLDGAKEVAKQIPVLWNGKREAMGVKVSATLGRIIIDEEPGNF